MKEREIKLNILTASLFIRNKFQNLGLGTLAMDILERIAVDRYNAKWITLDTSAHQNFTSEDGELHERFDTEGRSIAWYRSRGYERYRVSCSIGSGGQKERA